jgi:hypothetical protein
MDACRSRGGVIRDGLCSDGNMLSSCVAARRARSHRLGDRQRLRALHRLGHPPVHRPHIFVVVRHSDAGVEHCATIQVHGNEARSFPLPPLSSSASQIGGQAHQYCRCQTRTQTRTHKLHVAWRGTMIILLANDMVDRG